MKVMVTGSTGFVGAYLCDYLATKGISFRQAVRRNVDRSEQAVVVGDIHGVTDWSHALAGIEVVVHLAARVHVMHESTADPLAEFRKVNVAGTVNLARQAAEAGVRRCIYLSTIKVNGEETFAHPFYPSDKPSAADPYSLSKYEAETALQDIAGETGMEVVIIRPPMVYGKGAGGNFDRLVKLIQKGWYLPFGSIGNKRSLMGVENLCSLITACLVHPAVANRVLLACDGEDVSTTDLIRFLAQSSEVRPRLLKVPLWLLHLLAWFCGKGAEMRRLTGSLQIDSSQTKALLDWHPPLSLEEGIRQSVQK